MLYRTLRWTARVALRWFYRDIEVAFAERVPVSEPVLLVGNHQNALIDALIIGTSLPRVMRLTAKATLLDHPVSRMIVRALGIIPLRRSRDTLVAGDDAAVPTADQRRNTDAFRAIVDALGGGGMVLIFPEGISHSARSLAPLKTGTARIALQARRDYGLSELTIVPIGLTFERKWEPRSRVVMHVGTSLTATDVDDTPAGVEVLTSRIDRALRSVTLNFTSDDDAERMLTASALLSGVLDAVRPLGDPDPPLGTTVSLAQRLEHYRLWLPDVGDALRARAAEFVARLDALRDRLRAHRIAPNEIGISTSIVDGIRFVVREMAIVFLAGPLAVWGYLHHWIPLRLARIVARRLSRLPDEPAMHTLVAGLVITFAFYLAIAAFVAWWLGPVWAIAYLVLLPIAGTWDFRFRDRLVRAHSRARTYLALRFDPQLRNALLHEAEWLREEARMLDLMLQGASR